MGRPGDEARMAKMRALYRCSRRSAKKPSPMGVLVVPRQATNDYRISGTVLLVGELTA
jgi:uncharacterized lipoprotein YbaY